LLLHYVNSCWFWDFLSNIIEDSSLLEWTLHFGQLVLNKHMTIFKVQEVIILRCHSIYLKCWELLALWCSMSQVTWIQHKCASVPVAQHSYELLLAYDNMDLLGEHTIQKPSYVCGDLKVITFVLNYSCVIQNSLCFLREWDRWAQECSWIYY
jgi:hypothetical protein